MTTAHDILTFWFSDGPNSKREIWFQVDPSFDSRCRILCAELLKPAREGRLDHWLEATDGALALILLLDQMPRNIHRGRAEAFASDGKARTVARIALANEIDRQLLPAQRGFIYLPFEHAENIDDQDLSVRLFTALCEDPGLSNPARTLDFVHRHRDVIHRFGRFPHRNAALGRVSTVVEADYLTRPGAGF
ncbi:MAG: DUF924 domain-containing protein [Acetobacteraceae bacterium]|nr:DUF924 domain-containing protein [Acetobacteraceae bacterium]MSP29530.1 DUF924 domain-containing protein [Acetobacteraceae bacterium]